MEDPATDDQLELSGHDAAALARDVAARGRDDAADSRDSASQNGPGGLEAVQDQLFAAAAADRDAAERDRHAAADDRRAEAARASAATARDAAAQAREALSVERTHERGLVDRSRAADDRAASRLDRQQSADDRVESATDLRNAYLDALTGALLRDAGRDQLERTLNRVRRSGESLVIAFLDVDQLKQVNDHQGHGAGDLVLQAVGQALHAGLRGYDVVVRWGGDEFVCALPGTGLAAAGRRFAGVTAALAPLTNISVGLIELAEGESLQQAIERADRAMYDARHRTTDES